MRMQAAGKHTIYTIGHSTRSVDDFIAMLCSFHISTLADVRRFPGSRKFPQFDKELLEHSLEKSHISYVHLEALGGRRKVSRDSRNTRWRNASFRGYADYMETEAFEKGMAALEAMAVQAPLAYMCAEAVWWSCHRALISDYLKAKGWTVLHIMDAGKVQEHPYTAASRVAGGRVLYFDKGLFD